jgi:hypothetical protein
LGHRGRVYHLALGAVISRLTVEPAAAPKKVERCSLAYLGRVNFTAKQL